MRISVATVRLKYLKIYHARHSRVAYYRRAGVNRRLIGDDGRPVDPENAVAVTMAWQRAHADFEATEASARVADDARLVRPRSVAELIARYRVSPDFERLKPATKKDYEKALRPLEAELGGFLVEAFRPHHVRQLRDRHATRAVPDPAHPGQTILKPNARQANRLVAVLSILMSFARAGLGWRQDNPAERPRRLASDGKAYATWSRADFDTFMAADAVPEPLKRAAALGWYTGQRKGDCLAMTRAARKGGWLEVVPAKTSASSRARRDVPEHPELTRVLDAAPEAQAVTILTREDGAPWMAAKGGVDYFNHRFAEAVKAAGLPPALSFHGLRKGFLTWATEMGATDADLDSIVPHADPKVRAQYRAAANQRVMAKALMDRLTEGEA